MPPFHSRSTGAFRIALISSLGVIALTSSASPSAARISGEIEIDLAAFEDEPSIEPTRIDLPPDTALSTSPVPLEASAFEPEATQVFHRLPVEPTIDVADATELDLSLEFDETFGAPGEQAAPVAAADEQDRANADADAELAAAAGAPELGARAG